MIVFLQGEELAEIIGDFERVHQFVGQVLDFFKV
jgi:hypothetical protein